MDICGAWRNRTYGTLLTAVLLSVRFVWAGNSGSGFDCIGCSCQGANCTDPNVNCGGYCSYSNGDSNPPPPPPDTPDGPPWFNVSPPVTIITDCGGSDACHSGNPQLRVELQDCHGKVLRSETKDVPCPACSGGGNCASAPPGQHTTDTFTGPVDFTFNICGMLPRKVCFVPISSFQGHVEGACQLQQTEQPSHCSNIPLPDIFSMSQQELDCMTCPPVEKPSHGRAQLHKPQNILYTLRDDYSGAASYGETVNAEFRPPGKGILVIEPKNLSDNIDVFAAPDCDQTAPSCDKEGWQKADGRHGSRLSGKRTIKWPEDPTGVYQFNIRAYRGQAPGFDLLFHWYSIDADGCCVQHEIEDMELQAKPLPCLLSGAHPVMPELSTSPIGLETNYLSRLPCCGSCDSNNVCAPGDLSDWFVVTPPASSGLIVDGHAKDWYLNGTTLQSPGSDGLRYEFMISTP